MGTRTIEPVTSSRAAHLGPERRRPLVLDAALAVWMKHGYRGTTMALIAAEAKVSKPVLYACYDDKHQVLLALLDREEQRLIDAAQRALPESIDIDNIEQVVQSTYEAFFGAVVDYPASWRVVFEAQQLVDDEIAARIQRGRTLIGEQLAALVSHYFASVAEPLDEREARLTAENMLALAESNAALLLRSDGDEAWTVQELSTSVARFVLRAWPLSRA